MNRREIITGTLTAGISLALAPRAFAQVSPLGLRDRKLFAIAKEQQEKVGNILWRRDVVGIADFGLRSSEPRFHFVNFDAERIDSYRVSHGLGSDPEHDGWLKRFSNQEGSLASCNGAFMTYGWYTGRYGTSIRLEGLDPTNSNALDRAIVMHRAKYAEPEFLAKWGVLGRSNGCFAMSDADFKVALQQLGGGRVLYADNLGLGENGEKVLPPPPPTIEVLTPDNPTGIQQINPGVY